MDDLRYSPIMEFPETHWTVLAVATLNGGVKERDALDQLCREYWRPVAACIRARGAPAERVEDLTQEFFLQLMQSSFFKKADPDQGRFRTFMLGSLRYFLADDAKYHSAQKRGGHLQRAELSESSLTEDAEDAEFDVAWAELIFDRIIDRIKEGVLRQRGEDAWPVLRCFLPGGDGEASYETLAETLKISVNGAKTEVSRLRQRFREGLRAEIGRTVSSPHEIDEELAHLRDALERSSKVG